MGLIFKSFTTSILPPALGFILTIAAALDRIINLTSCLVLLKITKGSSARPVVQEAAVSHLGAASKAWESGGDGDGGKEAPCFNGHYSRVDFVVL